LKDAFKDLNDDSDEDMELNKLAEAYERKGARVIGFKSEAEKKLEDDKKKQKADKKALKRKAADAENAVMQVVPAPDASKSAIMYLLYRLYAVCRS
jgi:septum formation inhibitor MinC